MDKTIFEKIAPYRSSVISKLLENERIVKLLYYIEINDEINNLPSPEDSMSLYKTKIFPRANVEGVVETKECYVMLSFPYITPDKDSRVYMNNKIVFLIMCHKDVIDTFEGDRIDLITSEIYKIFKNGNEFGFKIGNPIVKELNHRFYYMSSIEFEVVDFAENI